MSGHDKQCAVTAASTSMPAATAADGAVGDERAAAPGPSKKCSQCSRDRPASAFSNAQLKLKGRRQCRDCIDPICMVCGKGDSARASGAPPASPATSTLRPLLVRRPQPAADFLILSHYSCAEMLSGRVDQNGSLASVPAGLCAILASHCSHCDRDGGALQCGGCSRVYHFTCGGVLNFAKVTAESVYPSNVIDCPQCTSQRAPLSSPNPGNPEPSVSVAVALCVSAAAAATSGSSSSSAASVSSSSAAIPAGSKKCAQCHLHLPESDYTASQLKAKGKRQCKTCVAQVQSLQALSPANAVASILQSRITALVPRLRSPLESEQVVAVLEFTALFHQLHNSAAAFSIDGRVATRLVAIMAGAAGHHLRILALSCVSMTVVHDGEQSPVVSELVSTAGAIPFLVSTLQRPETHGGVHNLCASLLAVIAKASRSNCDVLLAANALAVLLQHIRADTVSDVFAALFSALVPLLQGRTAAEAAAAVTHLGALIMGVDSAAPPRLLLACLNALGKALTSFSKGDLANLAPWVESILAAAPGIPQRLVELLDDARLEVAETTLDLMIRLFYPKTDQLRQLFDCGLVDKLLPLLHGTGGEEAQSSAAYLCAHAAINKVNALTLLDCAPITQRMLALLADSNAEMRCAVGYFVSVLTHMDRSLTRRLVDDYRFLPPFVAAFRRAVQTADQTSILWCLSLFANLLVVGVAESRDDERGVNPYIEPIDWEGVFELADPLQKHSDAQLAKLATRVFSYFIPNDCD